MSAPSSSIAIAAWPASPLPFPRYRRRRYVLSEDRQTPTLVGDPVDEVMTATGLTCLQLTEVDVADPDAILAFVNEAGTAGFGGGPDEQTVAEFVLGATVVRDAVSAWRVLLAGDHDESSAGDIEWHLPRLVSVDDAGLPAAAAEYLNDLLASGLSSFSPTIAVSVDAADEPVLDLNLHTLCCLELFNHVAGGDVFARCANESCGRLFVLDERGRRRGMRYCSRSCARAQAQREFRRRRARGEPAST
ncbi:MAG TPA: hypothetical protein VE444_05875 [Gaiellaceae bacterium]|nr:hypothetical protein [Gaiellaceae bacterium]